MIIDYKEELFLENTKIEYTNITNDIKGLYVADFETSKVNTLKSDVFVYATGLMNVNDNSNKCLHTNNIEDFIYSISNLPFLESEIYFHNLSFDVVFILLDLYEKGFEQIRNKYRERNDGGLSIVTSKKTKSIKVETVRANKNDNDIYLKRPFSYEIIYNAGTFYRVDLYFDYETFTDKKGRKKTGLRKVTLLDSYKIVPRALKDVSKDFLGYNMSKEGIDHNVIRETKYSLKPSEKKYLYEDVRVLKEFIKLAKLEGIKVNEHYKLFFDKMTTASQALNEYKTLMYDSFITNQYKNNKALNESFKNIEERIKKANEIGKNYNVTKDSLFNNLFPQLHPNEDAYLRCSYFGGITWKNTKFIDTLQANRTQFKGLVYDVNSLYPSVMRNKLLPYGKPLYYQGNYDNISNNIKNDYPLYIQKIRVKMFILKEGKMPNVQIRNSLLFNSTEYAEDNSYFDKRLNKIRYEECVFTFTNVQLKRFLDSYNIPLGIEFIDGYMFKGSYGLFDDYIDTFMELKKVGTGARKSTAKLMLNSLYGKFGTNPQREERIIQIDDRVFTTTNKDENNCVIEYLSNSVYLPMASFITSYARDILIDAVNSVFDRFLYCDTDSIHILGYEKPTNISIHDNDLGKWKLEGKFIDAKYIGAKRYAELMEINENDYKWEIKCCGVSSDIISKLDDIEVFNVCEYSSKELEKNLDKLYKKDDSIYYYKDKECSKKVIGLLRSKKKKNVKGGVLIEEQPYAITENIFVFSR